MGAPPVAGLALAYAAGVAWGLSGASWATAPLAIGLFLAAPIRPSKRPTRALWITVALLGAGGARSVAAERSCFQPVIGSAERLVGRFVASPRSGAAPFRADDGCRAFTVVTTEAAAPVGVRVSLGGTWMPGRSRPWLRADGRVAEPQELGGGWVSELRWAPVRWRAGLSGRVERLYGERAPLVAALTLARREGLDRDLSEAFARTGIAHLLAISGFHVGVIAGGALALLRLLGVGRRRAALGSAGFSWLYVGLIGFPDAACRAALILALVALSGARGRPPARWGALATAFSVLLVLDPTRLSAPGFQLSFLGAAGLVAWSRPIADAVSRATQGRCPRPIRSAIGAGVAATLATLPVVAWHFGRISLVGVPVTMAASPLVSLALPGAILSVLADFVSPRLALFLAGGVDSVLAALQGLTRVVSSPSWISVWTSRPTVVAGLTGIAAATLLARHPRIGGRGRRALLCVYVALGVLAWPLLTGVGRRGTLEVVAIDVGQGDAVALRSPRGRWLLVDTGPQGEEDPGAHPVVRALRARGVRRLEALVLTHPDLDHIGGATSVLRTFDVGVILDPALPVGRGPYADVLSVARAEGIPWLAARAGRALDVDGMRVVVLSPPPVLDGGVEPNEASVVLHVALGTFDVVLTGDAYRPTERRLAGTLPDVEILKVGHHGSETSTDPLLLEMTRPEVGLVSVGRSNRYGHPAPGVLERLRRAGVEIRRTDLEGTLTVAGRPDGTFTVRSQR